MSILENGLNLSGLKKHHQTIKNYKMQTHPPGEWASAAPDLLAACLECLEIIDRVPNACGLTEDDINNMPHVKRLRSAIKKAETLNVQPNNEPLCGV